MMIIDLVTRQSWRWTI